MTESNNFSYICNLKQNKLKTYKVILGGRGAELYIHPINEEKKQLLKEMDVENDNVLVDFDKLSEVLGVENWDYTDEIYSGPYDNPSAYHITVLDEQEDVVWQSEDDFYMSESESEEDYEFIEKENSLLIEHYVKGTFKEYNLITPENFDPEKLTPVLIEVNETASVITGLKYDNEEMEINEYGDNWSKGTFFHIL